MAKRPRLAGNANGRKQIAKAVPIDLRVTAKETTANGTRFAGHYLSYRTHETHGTYGSLAFAKGQSEMGIFEFLVLLLVAGICGALAQAIVGYSGGGCLVAIVLGFIGALLGTWLARAMGLPELFVLTIGDKPFPIIWSIIGAALFTAVLSLFSRPRRAWRP
jgi:uncharacterized membrane protein YeaQ/YmgE (transglycosylase-associated protein family)